MSLSKLNFLQLVKNYFSLLKPRVMWLNAFTGFIGIVLARNSLPDMPAYIVLLAIFLAAGGAGAFNMAIEHKSDKLMQRTKLRPIPMGIISPRNAYIFASLVSMFAILLMYLVSSWQAVLLLVLAIVFYVLVYTIYLKPRTIQNIVIGGFAGALPPLIGWYGAGGEFSYIPLYLVLIIFLWTPSHFWALCLFVGGDYKKANIPMAPDVWGEKKTRKIIFIYAIILVLSTVIISFLPAFGLSAFGKLYNLWVIVGGAIYLYLSTMLLLQRNTLRCNIFARKLFTFSIIYLFLIFLVILMDVFIKF